MNSVDEAMQALAQGELPSDVSDLVVELLGGVTHRASTVDPSDNAAGPVDPVFLESIEVEGFRGIGAASKLSLDPRCGLVLVVGANGCGKSSFAEAVERVITGSTGRWDEASQDGRENWRNLHASTRTRVALALRTASDRASSTVTVVWADGDPLDGGTTATAPADPSFRSRVDFWLGAVDTYPPVLPYAALDAVVSGKPHELHDAYSSLLGLDPLEEARAAATKGEREQGELVKRERDARKAASLAASASGVSELIAMTKALGTKPDAGVVERTISELAASPHSRAVEEWAAIQPIDVPVALDAIGRYRLSLEQLRTAETATADRATALTAVVEAALVWHTPATEMACPVCDQGTLDDAWRERATATLESVRADARQLSSARSAAQQALAVVRQLLPVPATLPGSSSAVASSAAVIEAAEAVAAAAESLATSHVDPTPLIAALADAVDACRAEAAGLLDERAARSEPALAAATVWLTAFNAAEGAVLRRKAFDGAKEWLTEEIDRQRQVRLRELSDRALQTWGKLSQTNRISLAPVELKGTSTKRRLHLSCETDGQPAMARSVLSQGEMHALALSLFLPRALHPDSPFGFVLIDDPVQALDQMKVDGLAELLAELGETRQVIVFTHDARLPDAAERLGLPVTVLQVERGARSTVTVTRHADVTTRAFAEAQALASDRNLDPQTAIVAIATSCKIALEAAAVRAYRRHPKSKTKPIAELDAVLKANPKTWDLVGLGMRGEVVEKTSDLVATPDAKLIAALKDGGHDKLTGWSPETLLRETRATVKKLFGRAA